MRRWQTTRGGASEIGPWSCPMLASRGLRGGGWGNAWPTEVAEGWLTALPFLVTTIHWRFSWTSDCIIPMIPNAVAHAADLEKNPSDFRKSNCPCARGWGSFDRHLSHVRSVLPAGWLSISKGPCTDRSRCLAAVPVIELSGVIPADHIHERIDVHGGLGAIVDVIRMLEHVEREDRAPIG